MCSDRPEALGKHALAGAGCVDHLGLGLKKLPYVVLGPCLPLFYSIILHETVWLNGLGDIEHSISLSLTSF
jgi:hypothetical protein